MKFTGPVELTSPEPDGVSLITDFLNTFLDLQNIEFMMINSVLLVLNGFINELQITIKGC